VPVRAFPTPPEHAYAAPPRRRASSDPIAARYIRTTIRIRFIKNDRRTRSIRMTLSLAFLAPEIAKAAVEGRLPHGFGLKRLVDLPMAWADQWRALELQAPAQA
jgi:hypothetical protein